MSNEANKSDWITATARIGIRRAPEHVFEFVCNPLNDPKWNPKVVEVRKLTPEPIGVGTVFRQAAAFVGGRLESEWQITDYQPYHLFRGKSVRGILSFTGSYIIDAKSGITYVTKQAAFDVSELLPPFIGRPLVSKLLDREFRASFERLRRLLEQR